MRHKHFAVLLALVFLCQVEVFRLEANQPRPAKLTVSVQKKIAAITSMQLPAGTVVHFSDRELQILLLENIRYFEKQGIYKPTFQLGYNSAWGRAEVEFERLRSRPTKPSDWLFQFIFRGRQLVEATVEIESYRGWIKVDIREVSVEGRRVSGQAMRYLLALFRPSLGGLRFGEPQPIGYNVDRIEIRPTGIDVFIGEPAAR